MLRETLKRAVGGAAEVLLPQVVVEVETGTNPDRMPRVKSAILAARMHRAKRLGRSEEVQAALAAVWRGPFGNRFHVSNNEARLRLTLDAHGAAVGALSALLASGRYGRLVEIGCGDALVLEHVMRTAPDSVRAVGLDLNEVALTRARNRLDAAARTTFVQADGAEWIAANPQAGTVLFTNGGVLEYFAPESVDSILTSLAAAAPAAVVMIEPLDPAHDLGADPTSRIFGREDSFSHNYPARLARAGFRVASCSEVQTDGIRWLMVAAEHA
jgi:SAM-dependent methyltransferase